MQRRLDILDDSTCTVSGNYVVPPSHTNALDLETRGCCHVADKPLFFWDTTKRIGVNKMMACKGDDEMGRTGEGDGSQQNEQAEPRSTMQTTTWSDHNTIDCESTTSGSCRDNQLIPCTRICKEVACPEHLNECSSFGRASLTMSLLQTFFLNLFREKGIKDPQRDVRLIVDYGMIDMCEGKSVMPDSQCDEITADISQENQAITRSTPGLVGWSGTHQPLEVIVEDRSTPGVAVFPVDSSSDQDSFWHESYRSIDMLTKDEVHPGNHESPTSIVDMLGWDDIKIDVNDPRSLLLSVQPPQASMSKTLSGNG